MNRPASTPWQTWAQDYSSDPENGIYDDHVDNEDADRYAHASWEACKARVLEILGPLDREGIEDMISQIEAL